MEGSNETIADPMLDIGPEIVASGVGGFVVEFVEGVEASAGAVFSFGGATSEGEASSVSAATAVSGASAAGA